jgi:hypothetical protein
MCNFYHFAAEFMAIRTALIVEIAVSSDLSWSRELCGQKAIL